MDKILCFGDCNVDIIIPINEMPVEGGCTISSKHVINMGGSGLNTAVAMNRLKLKPIMISQVGKDIFGTLLCEFLREQNITTDYISESEYPTGLVIGLVAPNGEKRWVSVRGNAADIHIKDYDTKLLQQSKVLYISGVNLVEKDVSRNTAIMIARHVKEKGGMVFLDPNIRVPTWEIDDDVKEAFERIYPYIDVLLPNEKELELLGDNQNVHESALSVLSKGVTSIWVKLGGKGCAYYTKNSSITFPANKVKVVDTSGAGDAFNAAVIYGRVTGFSAEETGIFANLFASHIVTKYGTTQALPDDIEIESMITETKRSN